MKSTPAPRGTSPKTAPAALTGLDKLFAALAGSWLALSFVKFGNPVIFGYMIAPPRDLAEFLLAPWPVGWGFALTAGLAVFSLKFARFQWRGGQWPILALAAWFLWQLLSHAQSVDQKLSLPTVLHFAFCLAAFGIGWLALGRAGASGWFWWPLALGFVYLLVAGFDQHYGGLEATRKAFYEQANWELYPKEYLLKIQSNRVFSTLVYPNAFAGVILLLFPVTIWKTWQLSAGWPRIARAVAAGLLAYLAAACLFWTGSKGGWLIALALGLVCLLHLRLPAKLKLIVMTASLVLGLVFFFLRFSAYFQKGATSVSARFIYWQAATQTAASEPILGTGPGTFSVAYRKVKPPDAEMARLAHNDYLEQASDSGIPGALAYAAFVFGSLWLLYRQRPVGDWAYLLLWLGVLGWALQSFIEFGLYIPGIAWPAFLFFGILWSKTNKTIKTEFR